MSFMDGSWEGMFKMLAGPANLAQLLSLETLSKHVWGTGQGPELHRVSPGQRHRWQPLAEGADQALQLSYS